MTGISVRGFAVASATAVTSVGAAVGVASGDQQAPAEDIEVVAADATLLAEIPAGTNAQLHTASLTQQAESQSTAAEAEVRRAAQEAARVAAAESAQERRAAAERAAEEEAEREAAAQRAAEEAQAASAAADIPVQSSYTKAEIQAMARQIVGADQFQCFSNIVDHESGWDHTATNPSSGAYGLMQALPGSKMASAGADWQTNPATQIRWGVNYMESRYGSPCGAWEFWQANNWY
ncbi:transglycosylase SLT domain-containing protein [Streptomyces sp. 3MP-14]|uniref:Transglycosylase SLT domain-containing protein n=1 Tax=Streptomyces mimosae TaxID=2586635 RepID=A0A5N6A8P4_9ACTN|nr:MULTISPECIES: transglycosylase SLT domain-containing protein [Streptomyces]KAB8165184.1 transglycosylase SLT domain-containing protein [Streptomyces mimosae]KAB8175816.1 transglycosylase SLT domain-containing protein [Streptomyces sp. 3MP-14]